MQTTDIVWLQNVCDAVNRSTISELPDHARVWVYQSSRVFTAHEVQQLNPILAEFAENWAAHGSAMVAAAEIILDRFIVFGIDEMAQAASGCSIDTSINLLKEIEKTYSVNLYDRMATAFITPQHTIEIQSVQSLSQSSDVTADTLVFDNLTNTVGDLKTHWLKPISESWHKRFVKK